MSHFGHISISAVKFHICCNKFSSSLDHQIQISSKPLVKPINFFLHVMRGAQRSAAGNQTRKRDVAELCGFLFLAWRHIPPLTAAIGPSRRTPWPLRVLRLFAWDSQSVRTVLGWTPETFSFYWLFTFARMPENHRGIIELFGHVRLY